MKCNHQVIKCNCLGISTSCNALQCRLSSNLGKPGKKSFMYFSSSLGKGFIISDDEEVTGVISVRNKVELQESI